MMSMLGTGLMFLVCATTKYRNDVQIFRKKGLILPTQAKDSYIKPYVNTLKPYVNT